MLRWRQKGYLNAVAQKISMHVRHGLQHLQALVCIQQLVHHDIHSFCFALHPVPEFSRLHEVPDHSRGRAA